MNKLNFPRCVWAGLILSLLGVGSLTVLAAVLDYFTAVKTVVCLIAGLYAAWIMYCSDAKTGRLLTPLAWLIVSAFSFHLTSLLTFTLIQAGSVWIVRCLYFHTGILAAGIDGMLTLCSLGAGAWALANSNWMLAMWSFFLLQSLAVWIPQPGNHKRGNGHAAGNFAQASANANAALRKLTSSSS